MPSTTRPISTNFSLPRTLGRPSSFPPVSSASLVAACPELCETPLEIIRDNLLATTPEMLAGTSCLSSAHLPCTISRHELLSVMTVPLLPLQHRLRPLYPTHILAISGSSSSHSSDKHHIFPVHGLVLAAHCSKLPPLPSPGIRGIGAVNLPVLPLALPSAPAFSILLAFMYTHRLDAVLVALLPIPPQLPFLRKGGLSHKAVCAALHASSVGERQQLAAHLFSVSGGSIQTLMTHVAHVKELWQDMVALGIEDPALWDTIELAYQIVLGALNLASK